ncbi:hypothetical protein [Amycolatopsis keratiniphila]|uniref:hypothetical protein n=1 Tax=Amycolatopsis keratiniphila TaxID=129921 RepID=UPI000F508091|nr:hypothetical protein [Amycolatopsis keratiniphila]
MTVLPGAIVAAMLSGSGAVAEATSRPWVELSQVHSVDPMVTVRGDVSTLGEWTVWGTYTSPAECRSVGQFVEEYFRWDWYCQYIEERNHYELRVYT